MKMSGADRPPALIATPARTWNIGTAPLPPSGRRRIFGRTPSSGLRRCTRWTGGFSCLPRSQHRPGRALGALWCSLPMRRPALTGRGATDRSPRLPSPAWMEHSTLTTPAPGGWSTAAGRKGRGRNRGPRTAACARSACPMIFAPPLASRSCCSRPPQPPGPGRCASRMAQNLRRGPNDTPNERVRLTAARIDGNSLRLHQ